MNARWFDNISLKADLWVQMILDALDSQWQGERDVELYGSRSMLEDLIETEVEENAQA